MGQKISKEALKKLAREKAYDYELQCHGCSQAVLLTFQELFGLEDELTFKAAGPLCAGLGMGKTCGALTGGVLVLGIKNSRAHIEDGLNGLFPGMGTAQRLVKMLEEEFGTTVCSEISKITDWTDSKTVMEAVNNPEFIRREAEVVGKTAEMVAELMTEES
jgi:C_GCAxxG_C_C family probable redox protein